MSAALIGGAVESLFRIYQNHKYRNKTISASCSRCHSKGNHQFIRMDAGGLLPFSGKKVFLCNNCGAELREDGTAITTLMERIDAFLKAERIKESLYELESLLARSQKIAAEDREELIKLKKAMEDVTADKELLKARLRKLIDRIRKQTEDNYE